MIVAKMDGHANGGGTLTTLVLFAFFLHNPFGAIFYHISLAILFCCKPPADIQFFYMHYSSTSST
jgi:hypothetical protein